MNKFLSILLAVMLIVSLLPTAAFAAADTSLTGFAGGNGEAASPYQIANLTQLQNLASIVNDGNSCADTYFVLTADIGSSASGLTTPIGGGDPSNPPANSFSGNFNGAGHTVWLNISGAKHDIGLFGYLVGGTIENVGTAGSVNMENGSYNVGGICGQNYNGRIIGCYNGATVKGDQTVGGVCGYNNGGIITNCFNTGSVTSSGQYTVGGVCGYNVIGTVVNCYNSGSVSGNTNVGSICGYNDGGTVVNCSNSGYVYGIHYVGGVCGVNNDNSTLANCYNRGNVGFIEGTSTYLGSVCGWNDGTIGSCYFDVTICDLGGITGTPTELAKGLSTEQCKAEAGNTLLSTGIADNKPLVDLLNGYTDNSGTYPASWSKWVIGDSRYPELMHIHTEDEDTITFETAINNCADLQNLFTNGGSGYLANNIVFTETLRVKKDVSLCLNDKVINLDGKWVIYVEDSANFNLYDCGEGTTRYYNKDANGLWTLDTAKTSGDYSTTGGVITHGSGYNAGAVYVQSGSFTMNGGNLAGNTSPSGAGGGVKSDDNFTINGGTICGNTAIQGGGVNAGGNFTINGGTISGNTASYGGGVNAVGAFTMTTGTIASNTASTGGGGVYVRSTAGFNMNGGTISGNTALFGGGVYVTDNTSAVGTFTMTDGTISGNTATYAGGIMNTGCMKLTAATDKTITITGNTATGAWGGIGNYKGQNASYAMHLSGKVVIKDNICNGTYDTTVNCPANLSTETAVIIDGTLTDSEIYITHTDISSEEHNTGVLTSGFTTGNEGAELGDFFTYDGPDSYAMVLNDSGELEVVTAYAITNNAPSTSANDNHGYLTIEKTSAVEGESVTIAVAPSSGYQLTADSLKVFPGKCAKCSEALSSATCANCREINTEIVPNLNQDGTYTFTMPSYAVTVTAEFKQKETVTITAENMTFTFGESGKKVSATVTSGGGALSYAVTSGSAISIDASGNLTIKEAGTSIVTITAAENETYLQATKDITVTINKADYTDVTKVASGKLKVASGSAIEITLPALPEGASYGEVVKTVSGDPYTLSEISGGKITVTSDGITAKDDMTFTVEVVPDSNHNGYTITVTITPTFKEVVTITAEEDGFTYGESGSYGYKNLAVTDHDDLLASLEKTYFKADGQTKTDAEDGASAEGGMPVNAGTYVVEVAVPESNEEYTGSTTVTFTIAKKSLTITANDISAYVGDEIPVLGEDDFEVSGLVGNDELLTKPLLAYDGTPDMTAEGSYEIVASGADAGPNYKITYQSGTLAVSAKPTGGNRKPAITVPVSGDENSIEVKATVSGNTATIQPIKEEEIRKVIGGDVETGMVVVDLSGVNRTITGVKLPTETVQAIAEAVAESGNDTAGLKLELSSGNLEFDAKALETIAAAADGADFVEIHFDEVGTTRLNNVQKEAVSEMDVLEGFEAYVIVNGKRVSDFEGGCVTVYIPYEVPGDKDPAAYTVWYVAEDGTLEKMDSTYEDENHRFAVSHFSDYVLTYDETVGQYDNCLKDETCPMSKFTDLDLNAWYHDGVHYCLDYGIMAGKGGGKFAPGGVTTRAQIVTILWNMNGTPYVNYAMDFSDVEEGQWYAEAVRWAAAENIVAGYTDGSFKPNAPITREQLAVILYNYAKYKEIDVTVDENTNFLSFNDFWDTSEWAKPAMMWAIDRELIVGTNWDLKPQGDAVRAQAATIIWKFCETVAK